MPKKLFPFLLVFFIGCLTYFGHELAHLFIHLGLGHRVTFKMNHILIHQPQPIVAPIHRVFVYGSGVLFTFLQGMIGYRVFIKNQSQWGFTLLLAAFTLRFAAAMLGFSTNSDEMKISIAMGLPTYFWTIIVFVGFLILIYKGKKKNGLNLTSVLGQFLILLLAIYLFSLIEI